MAKEIISSSSEVVRALDSQDDMPDVSNSVKYGQSQAFNLVPLTTDIHMFRRMAFGSSGTNSFDSEKYNRYSTAVFEAESTNQRGRTETRAQGSSSRMGREEY